MKDFIEHMNSTANYSFKYFSLGKRTHRHVKIKTYRKASGKSMKNLESRNANGNTVKTCYYTNGYTLDVMVFFFFFIISSDSCFAIIIFIQTFTSFLHLYRQCRCNRPLWMAIQYTHKVIKKEKNSMLFASHSTAYMKFY